MIAPFVTRAAALLALAGIGACGTPEARTHDDADASGARTSMADVDDTTRRDTGWIALFDGTDLSAWRGYRREDLPAGWEARDGLLALVPGVEGGDIITRDQYGDFELVLEWRVAPGGNSGIFYRAPEEAARIWEQAPEMQVLDDAGHQDGRKPITSAGAVFALYPVTEEVVKPAGEWNQVRIVARGPRVEHWLNGARVVAYQIGSDEWERRVAASKFADLPGFGEARRGHIGLQDHGDPVWFRDIRIRRLGPAAP